MFKTIWELNQAAPIYNEGGECGYGAFDHPENSESGGKVK